MRFDCVAPNNYYGALLATRALLAAGHRNLLHLRDHRRWTTLQRYRGFIAAIEEVPGATGSVIDLNADREAAIAAAIADRKAGRTSWTAAFCMHDLAAIPFVHGLAGAGFDVPRDISVVGFDDLPAAALLGRRLATIRVDCMALAHEAIALLVRRLMEPDAAIIQVECAVNLVAGETIAQFA